MLSKKERYERYLKEEYVPAHEWYLESDSKAWIEKNIPTLTELLVKNYRQIQPAVYCIKFNDIPVYVGEALKASDRLIVHAHNLYRKPLDYFGVEEQEISSGKVEIQMTILKDNINDYELRKQNELLCIDQLGPLLHKNDGTDRCIPRKNRRGVIVRKIINK